MHPFLTSTLALSLFLVAGAGVAKAISYEPAIAIPNPSPGAYDSFGWSVAALGGNFLVGAPGDGGRVQELEYGDVGVPGQGGGVGAVYLFDGTTGSLIRTFSNPNPAVDDNFPYPAAGDGFGNSVAALGSNVLVGASGQGGGVGAVYLFDGATGSLIRTFPNPSSGSSFSWPDRFGYSVGAVGGNVVVGAPYEDPFLVYGIADSGRAYLFDGETGSQIPLGKNNPQTNEGFGVSVAAAGDNVVVGRPGEAYLYDGTGYYPSRTFSPPPGAWDFGRSAAGLGSDVLVGAPEKDDTGAVYLLDDVTGSLLRTIPNPSPANNDHFGRSVSAAGNNILVGADYDSSYVGSAYLFSGATGSLLQTFENPTPSSQGHWAGDRFGYSLVAAGRSVLVGAPYDDPGGIQDTGSVYLFRLGDTENLDGGWGPGSSYLNGVTIEFDNPLSPGTTTLERSASAPQGLNLSGYTYIPSFWDISTSVGFDTAQGQGYDIAIHYDPSAIPQGFDESSLRLYHVGAGNAVSDWTGSVDTGADVIYGHGTSFSSFFLGAGGAGAVPEPPTLALLATGLLAAFAGGRRRGGTSAEGRRETTVRLLPPFALCLSLVAGAGVATANSFEPPIAIPNPYPAGNDLFGRTVAALGGNVLVGAPGDGGNVGAVHLFDGTTGSLVRTFSNPDPASGDNFGGSVAALGSDVLVGAPGYGGGEGRVYLLDGTTGSLVRTYSNPNPTAGDSFGWSVAAVGANVLVGAPNEDYIWGNSQVGSASLFDGGTGARLWTTFNTQGDYGSRLGYSVAALGSNALVGHPWADYPGSLWAGSVRLLNGTNGAGLGNYNPSPSFGDAFGYSVATLGSDILAGAPDAGSSDMGAAVLLDGTSGALIRGFGNPSPAANDHFGVSIAALGSYALVGAYGDGSGQGSAYLFDGETGSLRFTLSNPAPAANDQFGYSLAAAGGGVLVGAPYDDPGGTQDAGSVYLFRPGRTENLDGGSGAGSSYLNGVTIEFDDALSLGTTTLERSASAPQGLDLGGYTYIPSFWDISTTVSFDTSQGQGYDIAIHYDPSAIPQGLDESSLRLYHVGAGNAVSDWTVSVDTGADVIYGHGTSFSPFFLGSGGESAVPEPPALALLVLGLLAALAGGWRPMAAMR